MKKVIIILFLSTIIFIVGCTNGDGDNPFDMNENYSLEQLLMVSRPVENSQQDDGVAGVETELVSVTEVDWQVLFETEVYSILSRDVPEDMIFPMIGYPVGEDGTCNIGTRTRYQYVVLYENAYFDIWHFHQKYNNLSCGFLEEIGIKYSLRVN